MLAFTRTTEYDWILPFTTAPSRPFWSFSVESAQFKSFRRCEAAGLGIGDEELMLGYQRGDESCFGTLYDRYKHRIYRFILHRVWNESRAEELTHEVFLAVIKHRARWQPDATFKTYIYRIATNRCINERSRKEHQLMSWDDDREIDPVASDAPDVDAERRQMNALLERALARLEEAFRDPIVHELNGLSREEIAEVMEIPVQTVKTRIFRGKAKLKGILDELLTAGSQMRLSVEPDEQAG